MRVNDVRDVFDALEGVGARNVRLLLNRDATREAIFANWHELTELAGERDTLIFHYAGHGGRHDAILKGHEAKDNVFLLSGFLRDRARSHGAYRRQRDWTPPRGRA